MRTSKISIACVFLMVASVCMGGYVNDDFDGDDDIKINTIGQWSAPDSVVTAGNAAYLPTDSGATNTLDVTPTTSAWTDFDITPALGVEPTSPPTNTSSTLFYFDVAGNIVIWDSAWITCTNDVWGNTVPTISAGDTVRISIYQDYDTDKFALFLNERCLIQNADFPSSKSIYSSFVVQNVDSNASIGYVRIQATPYTANSNNNHLATKDITEMENNGYVARTLYVPGSGSLPSFASITLAAAAARDGDRISVAAGTYSESVTIAAEVTFIGSAFTINGLTINSDVTFEQNVTVGTININADVQLASGVDLNATTLLNITGVATLTGASGNAIDTADLDMVAGTKIEVTSGTLDAGDFNMDGTFNVDGGNWAGWGGSSIVAQALPFSDNFDGYTNNSVISEYGLYGWGASDNSVVVQSTEAYSGKALFLPDGTAASNSIDEATGAIWTEYFIQPAQGAQPSDSTTTGKSFMSYVDTNGFMVVHNGTGWSTCDNILSNSTFNGGAPAALTENDFRRIVIYQDFSENEFALFIDRGDNSSLELVAQEVPFPGGAVNIMESFVIETVDNDAWLDNVTISTTAPTGFANLDGDGKDDGEEISLKGNTLTFFGFSTIFKFI